MHRNHTSSLRESTRLSRRSLGPAAAVSVANVIARSSDDLVWADDAHNELLSLIKKHGAMTARVKALGKKLKSLEEDAARPVVAVQFSEIVPSLGPTGIMWFLTEAEIDDYFDTVLIQRESWAGQDPAFTKMIGLARTSAHAILEARAKSYEDWSRRIQFDFHEKRLEDAGDELDVLFDRILYHPCRCLSDAATKAQFVIEHSQKFVRTPEFLTAILGSIAIQSGARL